MHGSFSIGVTVLRVAAPLNAIIYFKTKKGSYDLTNR
ncbi:hypothetical protein KSS87_021102, partial [Heliosperma pusillum]